MFINEYIYHALFLFLFFFLSNSWKRQSEGPSQLSAARRGESFKIMIDENNAVLTIAFVGVVVRCRWCGDCCGFGKFYMSWRLVPFLPP